MQIRDSARRHGRADQDIRHAVEHALAREELDEHRVLWLGPDRAGNLLEIVILYTDQREIVIHAMKMRPDYQGLLAMRLGGTEG